MEQKFVSFSLDEIKNRNHDSKIRNSTPSVNQIASRMTKTPPWNNHHSVCRRLKFSNSLLEQAVFSSIERTDCISFSSPNPIVHRMTKILMSFVHSVDNRVSFGHSVGKGITLMSFGHSVDNRVSFGHSVGNGITLMSFGHSVDKRVSFGHSVGNRFSFGHSMGNGVKEIHSCACPLCWNKLAIMTCACDYNLKVFHDRWFCYNFGMTIELYLFLVSKFWL